MKLIESNIIIYSGTKENSCLRDLFYEDNSFFSSISKIEVLSYHKMEEDQFVYFSEVFKFLKVLHMNSKIIDNAVSLRQHLKLTNKNKMEVTDETFKGAERRIFNPAPVLQRSQPGTIQNRGNSG